MTRLTRLAATSAGLLVGGLATACGGGSGAPADASKDDFCSAQSSLFTDLDLTDPEVELPTEKEMADAMHSWAEKIEDVGTPENISDEARAGFEETVEAAKGVTEADLTSPDLDALGSEMSEEAQQQVEAFTTYVDETCGSVLGDLDLPELE